MSHIFQFEQLDQQNMKPRQELSTSTSNSGSSLPTTAQLTRIFSAAIGSFVMAFFFFILLQSSAATEAIAAQSLFILAGQVVLAGAMLALGVVLFTGIPLAVIVWQSTPRSRFLLAIPFLAVVLPLISLISPLANIASFTALFVGIPLTIVIWRLMPHRRFVLLIPFLSIMLLLTLILPTHLMLHMPRVVSLAILFADFLLTIVVWRLTPPPRIHFRLLMPFLATALLLVTFILSAFLSPLLGSLPFLDIIGNVISNVLAYSIPIIGNLGNLVLCVLICGIPMICTIAINSAIRQATISDQWLRFTQLPSRIVVFALIVMFLGLLFWGFYLVIFAPAVFFALLSPLNGPWNSWLLIISGMLVSVIVAGRALSSHR
jgi:hypothetical protein